MAAKGGEGRHSRSTTWRLADPPLVGITADVRASPNGERHFTYARYARAVTEAGGVPVVLPPVSGLAPEHARRLAAFVLTGGDDPRTEPFGAPTHPRATPVHPDRQAYETALLEVLGQRFSDKPVLGVCLGMQMMALAAGGVLDQCMEESSPERASGHWDVVHDVGVDGAGGPLAHGSLAVFSRHRQAVTDPGTLRVLARAGDGVVEAVWDPERAFYVGVQWHPERSDDSRAGLDLFRKLVAGAGER